MLNIFRVVGLCLTCFGIILLKDDPYRSAACFAFASTCWAFVDVVRDYEIKKRDE